MLKCSKEAFARCPTSHLCGAREESTFMEGSECDKFNQEVARQPQTNADRIRASSDGSAPALGAGGRRFESGLSHHGARGCTGSYHF